MKSRPLIYKLRWENSKFQMRDGKVRVMFNIVDQIDPKDWFGVFLRVCDMGMQYGSILVYVRKIGTIEIATYPGPKILKDAKLNSECIGDKMLKIELEGDCINANIDDTSLEYSGLNIQSSGLVKFASCNSNSEFYNAYIVRRDTIETFDILGLAD